jgi:hypothetical protein
VVRVDAVDDPVEVDTGHHLVQVDLVEDGGDQRGHQRADGPDGSLLRASLFRQSPRRPPVQVEMVPRHRHRPPRHRHRRAGQDPQRPPDPTRDGGHGAQRAPLRLHRQTERGRRQQPGHVDPTVACLHIGQLRRQRHQHPLAVLHRDILSARGHHA